VFGFLPAALLLKGGAAALEVPALWIGGIVGVALVIKAIRFYDRMGNTKTWPVGDPSRYSAAIKPSFGSDLAVMKNKAFLKQEARFFGFLYDLGT
jgi:hypothetical protein